MRISAAAVGLVAAAAVASASEQKVVREQTYDDLLDSRGPGSWKKSLAKLRGVLGEESAEARALWDEINLLVPGALDNLSFSTPKLHKRRPASQWDFTLKGSDLQKLWVESDGVKHRKVDGRLDNYQLRAKHASVPGDLKIDSVKQYSGYLDDEKQDKHLFYWFFESRNDPKNDPVVLWLNGGPGCSSMTGLFMELGPSFINKDSKPVQNLHSWNNNASVIFLDQPVNVGYSYSEKTVTDTVTAGKDVYALLTLFFHQFPQYAHQPFHIAGESYAGHYVPVFASEILGHKNRNINLKSVLVGNGMTDPLTQYAYYRPMACGDGGYPAVLKERECKAMDFALPACQKMVKSCYDGGSVWECVPASIYCNNAMLEPFQRTGLNVYDLRTRCKDPQNLCYVELKWIDEYLNKAEVKKALGVEVKAYEGCNTEINRDFLFHGDWTQPYHRLYTEILKDIPVLNYAGDADFICNWLGNEAWSNALEWHGQEAFNEAKTLPLTMGDGKQYGTVKSSGNFTFMRVYAAGHMVPMNQPAASADFFNRWLGGEWSAKKDDGHQDHQDH